MPLSGVVHDLREHDRRVVQSLCRLIVRGQQRRERHGRRYSCRNDESHGVPSFCDV